MKKPAIILTIAGSDCSGGAGIQADIKTISALGAYAASVITAITAQNTTGVQGVLPVTPEMVTAQIDAVMTDLRVDAVKIGMVNDPDIVRAIADGLRRHQPRLVVYDPVMVSTSGYPLMQQDAIDYIIQKLFSLCTLVTPNLPETEVLLAKVKDNHLVADIQQSGRILSQYYATAFLLKGGHADSSQMTDWLFGADGTVSQFSTRKIHSSNLHGTGCTLSSAIATFLGKGETLESAVQSAKTYLTEAIRQGADMEIGHGHGPVWHLHTLR